MADAINYNASYTGAAFHAAPEGYEYKCIRGPVGCLPARTEVMTPGGWVRIDKWDGEAILQWDSASGTSRFIVPRRFIRGECSGFLHFDAGRHFSMEVTPNHRVPLYGWNGKFVVKTAERLAARPSKHTVPTTWENAAGGIGLTDDEIRLWVAICADGHYCRIGKVCEFGLRRARKISRLREILSRMGIPWREGIYSRRDGVEETRIRFDRPSTPKHFDWRLSGVSRVQAEVFMDELPHWDGLFDNDYDRYDSTERTDAEIVQYVSHCAGRNATIGRFHDERCDGWSDVYTVHPARVGSAKNHVQIRCDGTRVSEVPSVDGMQYCFETDTGFFVVRQDGHIFVTGNSGKSVACCMDIFLKANEQTPVEVVEDGRTLRVRWSKWLIGRHTYKSLEETTVETWNHWFGPWTHIRKNPFEGRCEMPSVHGDGTLVRIDFIFQAFESNNIENDLMSLELSGAWINEATQVPWRLIARAHGRIGRFQPVKRSGVKLKSFGVIMDTNAPDETNWWYRKEVVERPEKMLFFVQPPALLVRKREDGSVYYVPNDGRDLPTLGVHPAENVENLSEGYDYWLKQTVGADPDTVKTLLLNQYGTSVAGMPVYSEWSDEVHCPKAPLEYQRGLTLLMGSDFGRTPATVVAQLGTDGVLRVLREYTSENMSVDEFIETVLMPDLANSFGFPYCPHINFGDPAGRNYNEVVSVSAIETFNRHGIRTIPAPGLKNNEFVCRRDAVARRLRMSYRGVAALQVDRDGCPTLRKGFNGHYCYRKLRTGADGDERYSAEADKNMYSHVHDAFQYLCVGVFESGIDYSRPGVGAGRAAPSGGEFSSNFDLL